MQKGFTLIELLMVVAVLGLLMIIIVPKALGIISNSKDKAYDAQIKKIEEAADLYVTDSNFEVVFFGNVATLTLHQLIDGGYIDEPVPNPKTGVNFNINTTVVEVTKNGNKYTFVVTPN